MKAKKVYEMIDPYASEDVDMDLDVSYKNKILRKGIEEWFSKWVPDAEYDIDKDLNIETKGSMSLFPEIIDKLPDNLTVNGYLDLTYSQIYTLPRNLTVKTNLFLQKSKIRHLPSTLKVYRNLDISNTKIIINDIPKTVFVGGKIINYK